MPSQNTALENLGKSLCLALSELTCHNIWRNSLALIYRKYVILNSVENIQFWLVITDFHKALDILRAPTCDDKSDHDESDIRAFADEIYSKYVKVGSELQINISSAQRKAIERALEKSGNIERSIFDNAQKEVYALMSRHSYPRYLASKNQEAKISEASKSKRSSTVLPSGR